MEKEEKAIKDFPMEGAMMSDLVAMEVIGALIMSDAAKELDKPLQQIVGIGFSFAKEFLRQREEWLKPKEDQEPKPSPIVVPQG